MLTKQTVIKILEAHGYNFSDLVEDLGDRSEYTKKSILIWMGY